MSPITWHYVLPDGTSEQLPTAGTLGVTLAVRDEASGKLQRAVVGLWALRLRGNTWAFMRAYRPQRTQAVLDLVQVGRLRP